MKEIFWNTAKDMLLIEDLTTGEVKRFDEMPRSFFIRCDKTVQENYPDVHEELCDLVGKTGHEYGRFYQFAACNFSIQDGHPDIDDDGNFITERVCCPMRHVCKRITCKAQITGKLSKREIQVVALFVKGFSEEEIADRLFISKATAHNHTTNIYAKLGYTGTGNPDRQLVAYAFKHKLV